MTPERFIIAIDGPCGAGKSTLARRLAKRFNIMYLNTGAIFRTVVYHAVINLGIGLDDISSQMQDQIDQILNSIESAGMSFKTDPDGFMRAFLNNQDVTPHIRTEEISSLSSILSTFPAIRKLALDIERDLAKDHNIIAEGRDIGTVVFPQAQVKFYLTADADIRARRRMAQIPGGYSDFESALKDVTERDRRDMNRASAPLIRADNAFLIDSTALTLDETEQLLFLISKMALHVVSQI